MLNESRAVPSAKPVVLIGTDFSEVSAHALAEARVLALLLGGSLRIVHVSERPGSIPWSPDADAEMWLSRSRTAPGAIETRSGTPWIELARFAEECGAALVVVGTHGRTGFQTVALGSTASRLTLLSPRPVLLVNGRTTARLEGRAAPASTRGATAAPPTRP
jgi:nucleotide-binding universal stress UspA family protein